MSPGRYTYWHRWTSGGEVVSVATTSLEYGRGYLACHRSSPGPRLGLRLVRVEDATGTERVLEEVPELTDVYIGMIAGHPSAAQYRAAAARAIALAEMIEEREERERLRRAGQLDLLQRSGDPDPDRDPPEHDDQPPTLEPRPAE